MSLEHILFLFFSYASNGLNLFFFTLEFFFGLDNLKEMKFWNFFFKSSVSSIKVMLEKLKMFFMMYEHVISKRKILFFGFSFIHIL